MKQMIALVLSATLALPGCATTGGTRASLTYSTSAGQAPDRTLMTTYLRGIPVGSRVRADLAGGRRMHATLMAVDEDSVVLRPHTRVPEPPLDVPLTDVLAVELDRPASTGKAIAAGAAAGAAATFGVLLMLYLLMGGD
jgi:hypothetical protein